MIPDNSDTTHLDAYPVKRAWSSMKSAWGRLPWLLRNGIGGVALVVLFHTLGWYPPALIAAAWIPVVIITALLLDKKSLREKGAQQSRWDSRFSGFIMVSSVAPLLFLLIFGGLKNAGKDPLSSEFLVPLAPFALLSLAFVVVGVAIVFTAASMNREARRSDGSGSDRGLSHEDRNDPKRFDGYGQPRPPRPDDLDSTL